MGNPEKFIRSASSIIAREWSSTFAFGASPTAPLSVQVVPLTTSGGGGCGVSDSPYVPAGYKCIPSLSDEFNGKPGEAPPATISFTL
jgi:hypothetical protein